MIKHIKAYHRAPKGTQKDPFTDYNPPVDSKLTILVVAFIFAASPKSKASCGGENMIRDTIEFSNKVSLYFSGNDEKAIDHKSMILDRSGGVANAVNSAGIISLERFNNKMPSYESATLVSPCHVLTAAHGIEGQFSKTVFFSVGQNSCESPNHFKFQNLPGRVVENGAGTTSSDLMDQDWAIIRLNNQVPTDIQPSELLNMHLPSDTTTVMVGFPSEEVQSHESMFRFAKTEFVALESVDAGGMWEISKKNSQAGSSGSGMHILHSRICVDQFGNIRNCQCKPDAFYKHMDWREHKEENLGINK